MKILQIHTKMVSGGIEAIVCGLVNEMCKIEDVSLCTIFKPTDEDVFYKRIQPGVKKSTIGKLGYGFSIKEIFKIYNFIRNGNFDIVHVHGCFQYYFLAMLLLHSKTRFIYTIHSDAYKENQKWDWRLFKLKKYMFRKGWVIPVTISNASQASFNELYRCKSELIVNGTVKPEVDITKNLIESYRRTPMTKVFLHAGRVSKAKNQEVLCRVFKQLCAEGNDVVLLIAGSAEDKIIFEQIEPYFNNRIVYLGERNDVPQLMAFSDGFCLPSVWEGLPITLLESLSVGCIPICSPVGGIVDVIHSGENGFLSKSSSENDYSEIMKYFLKLSTEEIMKIKNNAIETFNQYDIKLTSQKYLHLYQKVTL